MRVIKRPIATDVARSVVCASVCALAILVYSAVQKRLNHSRCRLGATSWGLRNHVLDGVKIERILSQPQRMRAPG